MRGFAVALLFAACQAAPDAAPARPNVVVFFVDDLGWQDLSEPFGPERTPFNARYHTPNVERLCRQGIKFTDAYAHTVCTPSRVSLLTGMAAARHGVTHWTLHRDQPPDRQPRTLQRPDWNYNGLCPEPGVPHTVFVPAERTLAGRLRAAGYRTILVGKAHFGAIGTPGADPTNLGFDVNVAGHAAGAPSSYLAKQNFLRAPNDTLWQVPGLERWHGQDLFLTDVLTTEALGQCAAARERGEPFFLYLAHYAVHAPLDADERFVQRYRDAGLPEPEARYAALVEGMDHSLGRVLDWLQTQGLEGDTLVLFASDNGGLSAHARGGEKHTHNAPLRSGKGSAYEGGTRVPLAVRWPGHVRQGAAASLPVQLEDVLPTVCDLLGIDGSCADGHSFAPTLRGEAQASHPLFWHHPHQWGADGPGIEPYSAVRDGDLELIWFHEGDRFELYDVRHDLGERHDLAAARPADTQRLRRMLHAQLRACGAQLPRHPDGRPIDLP